MGASAQLEFPFPSLDFPGRTTLYPREVAERLGCSIDQVHDLTDDASLVGIDIASQSASRRELRFPIEAWRNFILTRMTGPLQAKFLRELPPSVRAQLLAELIAIPGTVQAMPPPAVAQLRAELTAA